jgi:hypothetical protein
VEGDIVALQVAHQHAGLVGRSCRDGDGSC